MFITRDLKYNKKTDLLLKITPFENQHTQLKAKFKLRNNFYACENTFCGIITEIGNSDEWLDEEMSWVSRSEIPFITTIRHSQICHEFQGNLVSGLNNE